VVVGYISAMHNFLEEEKERIAPGNKDSGLGEL
jgi:hypothetical protein